MSGIVLSASVRQNLLSLQSTASLLATTQNDLATGNKVNSALDNPTNYFTAQALNNRASDIGNLLDGIGNGVQVLQAANTGITSLQSLVSSAQSIANQVLQSPTGYSAKSNVSSATIPSATAQNLLGNSIATTVTGTAVNNNLSTPVAITGATALSGASNTDSLTAASQLTTGDTLTVNGVTFTFVAGSSSGGTNIGIGDTVAHLLSAIDAVTGATGPNASSVAGGKIILGTGTTSNLTIGGSAVAKLGLTVNTYNLGPPPLSGETLTVAATGGGTPTN